MMKPLRFWLLAALAALPLNARAGDPAEARDLVVHEWGTFLAMAGADGVTLDGMYHEEHALPSFVHARSRDQLRLPWASLKGETPVIYFYNPKPLNVFVDVRFPRGVWTQWYPQARIAGPNFSASGDLTHPRNGRLAWSVEITPPTGPIQPRPPATSRDALWNFARQVDASYVRSLDETVDPHRIETERFLFYRGLGMADLPLRVSAADGGTIDLPRDAAGAIRHIFIVRVEDGKGAYASIPSLDPGNRRSGVIPSLTEARPLDGFCEALGADLRRALVASGLFDKEALALVNTWQTSYFRTEGVRVLFILPRAWTDQFIPLSITPTPRETVRVMVGRVELLTPERERLADEAVQDLFSEDAARRESGFAYLRDRGRYVEPIIRRVLQSTKNERVATLCRRLLAADFVTELRAAIHDASDGRRVLDEPVYVRAQLATLLREVGLDAEAKAEGRRVLDDLKGRPIPAMDKHNARHPLRAIARAHEAIGDDRAAADAYARLIQFGSQALVTRDCRGCHEAAHGPTDAAWFRDWWAGRHYAAATARLGETDRSLARLEAAARANPNDVATRLLLSYLRDPTGKLAQ